MSKISTRPSTPLPAPSSSTRDLSDLLAKFTNRLEEIPGDHRRCLISAASAPRGAERQQLDDRRLDLTQRMMPSPGRASNDEIEALLAAFPSFGLDAQAASITVALYADALDDVPTWAIAAARRRFVKGSAVTKWDRSRCPTPPQVVAECREVMLPFERERIEIAQVLDAIVVDGTGTPEERAEAVAAWETMKAGFTRTNDVSERRDRERAALRQENVRAQARRQAAIDAGLVPPTGIPSLVVSTEALQAALAGERV